MIVDLLFKAAGLEPTGARHAKVTDAGVSLNYTTVLNKRRKGAADLTRLAAPTRITTTMLAILATGASVAACGGSSSSPNASVGGSVAVACRASGPLDQTHVTAAYVFLLHLGPQESMLTLSPADARARHITTGELMIGGTMSPGTSASAVGGNVTPRHLEVHICRRSNGKVVTDARPTIAVAPAPSGSSGRIPVAAMEGVTAGPADLHYGNNVTLHRGTTYTITVRLDADSASFKATAPRGA